MLPHPQRGGWAMSAPACPNTVEIIISMVMGTVLIVSLLILAGLEYGGHWSPKNRLRRRWERLCGTRAAEYVALGLPPEAAFVRAQNEMQGEALDALEVRP